MHGAFFIAEADSFVVRHVGFSGSSVVLEKQSSEQKPQFPLISDATCFDISCSGGFRFCLLGFGFLQILKFGFGFYTIGFQVFVGFLICAKK